MRRGLICAAAIAAMAVPAAPAAGAPPPGFYGVVAQSHLKDADFERMGKGRVGTVRATMPWVEIDPSPVLGDEQWQGFDQVVAGAARANVRVLPTAYTVPAWVNAVEGCEYDTPGRGPCTITGPRTEVGLEGWRSFLAAAAARYGPGGTFWLLHPHLPYRPIRAWQMWNEPNSPGFYRPGPDPEDYAELVRAGAAGVRSVDPNAEIVLGGLFRSPELNNGGMSSFEFITRLYAVPGVESWFDSVAIHPYAARMKRVRRSVRLVLDVVAAHGDTTADTWITEVGWSSHGKRNPLNRGRRGQARRLRQAFDYFTRERRSLRIRGVLWYAWQDVPRESVRCQWCAASGLFEVGALDPKPAWRQFTRFTGGT